MIPTDSIQSTTPPVMPRREHRLASAGVALGIALVTFVAFAPVLRAGFVAWDDHYNFLDNPHYRGLGWAQFTWMLTTAWSGHWIPLTWLTLSVDWALWGMNPFGYHLTNLVLHAANGALCFALAARILARSMPSMTASPIRTGAAAAALVFAVHPLRAEAVAWVSERRDVLSGLFYLVAVLTYLEAVEAEPGRRRRWMALSVAAFVLAMLSKAIVVSLPIALLVLDVYPLRRLRGSDGESRLGALRPLLIEKLPYVVVAVAGAFAAARLATAFKTVADYPLWVRPSVFGDNLVLYAWNTVLPSHLSPLYELPPRWDPRDPGLLVGLVVPAAVTVVLLAARRRWPAGLAVWAVYVSTLVPVAGLIVHTGPQIAADRYSYLACLGFALLLGGAVCHVQRTDRLTRAARGLVNATVVGGLLALATLAWKQSAVWQDTVSLWRQAVAVDPACARCQNGLGAAQHNAGASAAALGPLQRAVALRPDMADFHADLGIVLLWLDRAEEAVPHLQHAVQAYPGNLDLRAHLGTALVRTQQLEDGQEHLESVLRRRPDHVEALVAMGFASIETGRLDDAVAHFERAALHAPRAAAIRVGLFRAHRALGDHLRAEQELATLRGLDPELAEQLRRR